MASEAAKQQKLSWDMQVPQENVRNFCIVAHIDHGKSTLADRLLGICGAVSEHDAQL